MRVGPAELMPTRLPSGLNCLKRLCLSCITLEEFFEFSFVFCLIRSSPNLEEIGIEIEVVDDVILSCSNIYAFSCVMIFLFCMLIRSPF